METGRDKKILVCAGVIFGGITLRCAVMRWNCLSQTAVPVVRIAGRNQNKTMRYWKAAFYHASVKGKWEKGGFLFS